MGIAFDSGWIFTALLIWIRLGAMFLLSPMTSTAKMPPIFLMLLTGVMAGLMASGLPRGIRPAYAGTSDISDFALQALAELVIGAALGFALQCALAAAVMAGSLIDVQMGLGVGAILNPVTHQQSPVIGTLLALLATAYFFAMDAPHAMFRAFAYSLDRIPLGTPWLPGSVGDVLAPFGAMFTAAVMLAAPALFILLMLELLLLVAARLLPQMNVFFVGLPAKILVGLSLLSFVVPFVAPVLSRGYGDMLRWWDTVLR